MQRATASGLRSMRTPSASSTSAEPDRPVAERLPCLATAQPAPAAISAAVVETLNVGRPPPVPAVSIRSLAAGRAPAWRTRASSWRGRRARRPSPPSCAARPARRRSRTSEALPSMISASTAAVCVGAQVAARRQRVDRLGEDRVSARKFSQQPLAVGGEHGLGVELDAERRQLAVAHRHQRRRRRGRCARGCPGRSGSHDERVIARRRAAGSAGPRRCPRRRA